MKNLANCKPSEFLVQTNKIRKAVAKWLTDTDIANIRKIKPELKTVSADASAEDRIAVIEENSKRMEKQARENLMKMLDAIMDEHPKETLDLLALLCFVEPKDVDEHTIGEYLESFTELINDKAVLGFFTSLAQLGLIGTSN